MIREYDGNTRWYKDDNCTILHREDGPAIIYESGIQFWFLNGKLHREDGPATIYSSGSQEWWLNGQRHRTDGPASIYADGCQEWWLNGQRYLYKKKFQKAAKLSDEDMTMLLLRYNFD